MRLGVAKTERASQLTSIGILAFFCQGRIQKRGVADLGLDGLLLVTAS